MAEVTQQQKQALEALGIDLSKIDWGKVGVILMQLLQFLLSQQPKQAKALDCCSHQECCLAALKASLEATAAAAHCYQTCSEEPTPAS
jgi:hypothetical protein